MAKVKIIYGNTQNEYSLFQLGTGLIKARFSKWSGNAASEVTITSNNIPDFQIIRVDFTKKIDCSSSPNFCNELQIKGKYGTPNTGSFSIQNGPCDLDNTQIWYVKFTTQEIIDELHLTNICENCYSNGLTPDTEEGNILVGKDN